MGFLLAIIARILFVLIWILNPIFVFIKNIHKRAFWEVQNKHWFTDALELDIYGNYACRTTWNIILQRNGYGFGNKGETISSALGKNQRDKTLTGFGKVLCWILDRIDRNHCANSIKD